MDRFPQDPQLVNVFLSSQFWLSHAIVRILSYSVHLRVHVWLQDCLLGNCQLLRAAIY